MITLKDYQERVLESLGDFFRLTAQTKKPEVAFREVTRRFGEAAPYFPVPAAGLGPDMPYVCLRVPTGGGKTLLACYAAGLAQRQFMRAERAVVLWLVPSNTILDQTADALRDPHHPYRRALELACGAVEVMTIDEALRLSRAVIDGQTVVIVSTIQSFRVEDTTGRRVYDQNGSFSDHVAQVPPDRLADLFPGADGKPKPSLVNALRLRRPIVIVDEAHNARTDLSFATLGNVLPSCIVEFTATPAREKTPSNVLHRVSAAELKIAQMVKLPLRVVTRHPSQRDQLLAEAITLRADLERLAVLEEQQTAEYIRPILLIQAERVDACEPLRDRLVREFGLSNDEVKISVGRLDELKGVRDIASPKCPVRMIITVEKLREGWDCPFAYVLCSLKETWSATAIEQIVGRILRLPNAQAKRHPDLNCAYAFSVSDSITTVLAELREALEHNGFTKAEAERIILSVPQGTLPLGVQPQTVTVGPAEIDPTVAQVQEAALGGKVRIDAASGAITIVVPLDRDDLEKVQSCVTTPDAKARLAEAAEMVRQAEQAFGGSGKPRKPSPYEQQLDFLVPLLCFAENGMLYEFESTFLLDHPWKLSEKDASLPAAYNPLARPYGNVGVIDVGQKGDVQTTLLGDTGDADFVGTLHQQMFQFSGQGDWSLERLVAWLDREIDHHDIPVGESAEFLRKVIRGLMAKHGIADIGTLALDRFRLRDEIAARIQDHREGERKASFQLLLLSDSPLTVTEERAINFKTMGYEPSRVYEGGFQFQKHYFGPKPGELTEKTAEGRSQRSFSVRSFWMVFRLCSSGSGILLAKRLLFVSKPPRTGSTRIFSAN
ncbi:MAG: DEAD/DEAH box helicase family protein [Nitrospira sp.]|nr:DEAD/DEAH box helicase family protein [Nitrospira sp.]